MYWIKSNKKENLLVNLKNVNFIDIKENSISFIDTGSQPIVWTYFDNENYLYNEDIKLIQKPEFWAIISLIVLLILNIYYW